LKLSDIVTNPATGRLSLTKLAAATGHLNAAVWFAWLTFRHGFVAELWMVYLGATITHNGMSKAIASVRDVKMAQAASESGEEKR
jgi:hypothetical protein